MIHFFYLYTTIRPKIRVLIDLFLLYCTTLRPNIRATIYLFLPFAHDHSTKYIIFFHLYFLCAQPFDQKSGSSLMYFFYLHTTIRQKYMIVCHLFFLSVPPFDQKLGPSLISFFYLYTIIRSTLDGSLLLFNLFFS